MNDRRSPLTARSVVASTLLGTDPPALPVSSLVRTGVLFGMAEGTVRTALSRMVAAGEARTDGSGRYSLAGALEERQQRQQASRAAHTEEWNGQWLLAVVAGGARSAAQRSGLRTLMRQRRLGELREGVWTRPDNLDLAPDPADGTCQWFRAVPTGSVPREGVDRPPHVGQNETGGGQKETGGGESELAATLWDLTAWSSTAAQLLGEMAGLIGRLDDGDVTALAEGFVVSAAVLRHFGADPLLPAELLPADWNGTELRREYDRYDAAYRRVLADWLRTDA